MEIGLVIAGFAVWMLVGLSGMGGGALVAPFLIGVVGVRPLHAVGTDLLFSVVTKLFGAYRHRQLGSVDLGITAALLAGALPGVWLGSGLSARLPRRALSGVVATVLLATGLRLI
jgi:uncharacterized membrane protein YfcA